MPAMSTAAKRIEQLREEIRRHDHLYYVEARPRISDREYDNLFDELKRLEEEHAELITPDSPTQRVGGAPIEGFRSVAHSIPMLSIDNTYNEEQLRDFDERVRKGLGSETFEYIVEPKIDGVAVSLRYEKGLLVLAATRGDGVAGDDITVNARTIQAIPLSLEGKDVPDIVEPRGEIVWPVEAFRKFNEKLSADGKPTIANPRNGAAGTLKQLDPRKVAGRGLSFVCHGFGRIEPLRENTGWDIYDKFEKWGIPIRPPGDKKSGIQVEPYREKLNSIDEVIKQIPEWDRGRKELPFETDGLVIKVNALDQRDALGATSRYPRWCIAYKFAAERAESKLLKVDFWVGKQGTITPRAVMEPVQLSGTTVRHASLHNFDQIDRLDVRIGDTVIVEKAGEIIPQVIEVVKEKRPRNAQKIERPKKCPECSGAVEQDEGGVYLRCINPACPAQLKERLTFFAARDQMDIDGLGQVLVEKMVDKGWLQSFADIYRLPARRHEIPEIEIEQQRKTEDGQTKTTLTKFGEKRTEKLLDGIERSKKKPLSRVLAAMNIRHVGAATAELIAEHLGNMQAIAEADAEALQEVEGIGPEVAGSIRHFFTSPQGAKAWKALRDAGVNMTQPKRKVVTDSPLAGKTVVVTGTLESMGRKEAQDLIKQLGGKSAGSVSRKTDLVVVGESPGSKLDDAKKHAVKVIDEEEFLKLVGR
jgi:DNA ligase (NAD+)